MRKIGICFIIFFLYVHSTFASILINEIYPAPDQSNFEWVELYNNGDSIVDLSMYSLVDSSGKKLILNSVFIDPKKYSIATSSGVLNNTGDTIILKDSTGFIVDKIIYEDSLDSQVSLTRCVDNETYWKKTSIITKNASNELSCFKAVTSPTANETETPTSSDPLTSNDNDVPEEMTSIESTSPTGFNQTVTSSEIKSGKTLPISPVKKPLSFNKKHALRIMSQKTKISSHENVITIEQTNTFANIMLSLLAWAVFASTVSFLYSIKVQINKYKNEKEYSLQDAAVAPSNTMDGDYLSTLLKTKNNSE